MTDLASTFSIEFWLGDDAIARAVERRELDDEDGPSFGHFDADVSLIVGGRPFPDEPLWSLSLADLAWQLARMLSGDFLSGPRARYVYVEQEDVRGIEFDRTADRVVVTLLAGDRSFDSTAVESKAFAAGCREFIARFLAIALPQVPRLLEWSDLQIVGEFLNRDEETRRLLDRYCLDGVPTSKLD